jgi:hypothetical protein
MRTFQIECGRHKDVVQAKNPSSAWHKVVGKAADGFGKLARFRECLPATAGRKYRAGWQPWNYITPRALDFGETSPYA